MPEEYLALEANSPFKHEYWDGEVYAMAGASDPHVTIAGNLFAILRPHVRGSDGRVFMADMKLTLPTAWRMGILGSTKPLKLEPLQSLTQRWDSPQA
jgi:Uma2 family endonuclease